MSTEDKSAQEIIEGWIAMDPGDYRNNIERYLKVSRWLWRRYAHKDWWQYKIREQVAWDRYMIGTRLDD